MPTQFIPASRALEQGVVDCLDWHSANAGQVLRAFREFARGRLAAMNIGQSLLDSTTDDLCVAVEDQIPTLIEHIQSHNVRSSLMLVVEFDPAQPGNRFDKYVRLEAAPGSIFLPVKEGTCEVGLVSRHRPQPQSDVPWDEFVAPYPNIDLSRIGRDALTVPRWFGGQQIKIEQFMQGELDTLDSRMVRYEPLSDGVANDAWDVNHTHYGVAVINPDAPAEDTEFGRRLTGLLSSVRWHSRSEVRRLIASGALRCQFAHSALLKAECAHPEIMQPSRWKRFITGLRLSRS
jgi:hypothetical protein